MQAFEIIIGLLVIAVAPSALAFHRIEEGLDRVEATARRGGRAQP